MSGRTAEARRQPSISRLADQLLICCYLDPIRGTLTRLPTLLAHMISTITSYAHQTGRKFTPTAVEYVALLLQLPSLERDRN